MATPKETALSNKDRAQAVVLRTRAVLQGLLGFKPTSLPIPRGVLVNFDKVWAHFKAPKFPISTMGLFPDIKSLDEFLNAIDTIYVQILANLGQAGTLFRDLPMDWFGPTTFAFSIGDVRDSADPPKGTDWPNGIYFKEKFGSSGGNKKLEVIVHECAHFPKTQMIQDNAQPGSTTYIAMGADLALRNAWSYSQFALDCAFNRAMPFDEKE